MSQISITNQLADENKPINISANKETLATNETHHSIKRVKIEIDRTKGGRDNNVRIQKNKSKEHRSKEKFIHDQYEYAYKK